MKIDNRKLVVAIGMSLAAHAALLLSLGAPAASGSGAAGSGMQVVLGSAVTRPDDVVPERREVEDTKPRIAEVTPPDATPVAPAPVEVRKAEAPPTTSVEVRKPEPRRPDPKAIAVDRTEAAKPVEIDRSEPTEAEARPVTVARVEPPAPERKPVTVERPAPRKVEVKPIEKAPPKPPEKTAKVPPKPPARTATARPKPTVRKQPAAPKAREATKPAEAPKKSSEQTAEIRPGEDGNADKGAGSGGMIPVMRSPRFGSPPRPAVYPRLSVQREEEGTVVVRALVHRRGIPSRVSLWRSSGYPRLDDAAVEAVRKWIFLPMQQGGRTVAAWVEIPVRFRLQ